MLKMVASSLDCWQQHMGLDNGTDPEGIKVRPAAGLGAADFLFPGASSTVPHTVAAGFWVMSVGCLCSGFWVWGPLIENLALIGYTGGDNLAMAPYDWR